MKILLVTPAYHSGVVESAGVWMNVAFVHLAGSLRARGHDVEIYDAMSLWVSQEEIRSKIERSRPDLVALTAITASFPACVAVCRDTKEIDPGIVTVLGNVHPTFMWREVLTQEASVDYVVRGEGEHAICDLADALSAGDDLAKVKGIAWRRDGRPVANPRAERIANLDALPMAWDLVDWPIYTYRPVRGSTLAVVSSSRGCEQHCLFCSQMLFWKNTWRARSPESFVGELEHLSSRFGVNVAMLSDETPTVDRARWERILDLLVERRPGVELLMETRVADILRDEDLLPRYREAGVSHIYVGVESVDQGTLDTYEKGISVEQSRRAIELINQHDMVSETSFVIGMPDETPERIARTIELAKLYGPDMAFFLAICPWPYGKMHAQLEPHIATTDYSRYNLVQAVVKPEAMTIDEVNGWLARAAHEFFAYKFQNLDRLTPEKRHFMVRVMDILMRHSYLAPHMRQMRGQMPPWVRTMLDAVAAEEETARTGAAK